MSHDPKVLVSLAFQVYRPRKPKIDLWWTFLVWHSLAWEKEKNNREGGTGKPGIYFIASGTTAGIQERKGIKKARAIYTRAFLYAAGILFNIFWYQSRGIF